METNEIFLLPSAGTKSSTVNGYKFSNYRRSITRHMSSLFLTFLTVIISSCGGVELSEEGRDEAFITFRDGRTKGK